MPVLNVSLTPTARGGCVPDEPEIRVWVLTIAEQSDGDLLPVAYQG